ncbi:hypothetical protein CDD83_10213 [Cordyceps sp. RAO-2017]|nr:hypothetical protein CDD83_10213 [Cordyceps sp. RAO-2017]
MTRSSPLRGAQLVPSPDRALRSSFLLDQRNTESSHLDALSAAQAEHTRIRQAAIRVYELHELKEEHQRILDEERREEARLRAEAQIAAEEKKLQELKAKTIPKPVPPPAPKAPPPTDHPAAQEAATRATQEMGRPLEPTPTQREPKLQLPAPAAVPAQNGLGAGQRAPAPTQQAPARQGLALPKPSLPPPQPDSRRPDQPATRAPPQAQARVSNPAVDRLIQIHQALKQLRKDLTLQSKAPGSPLKGKLGAFRREIRGAIGQLTGGKGAHVQSTDKITSLLRESLQNQTLSPPVEVGRFVEHPRSPAEGAQHNDATLPALFVYLINVCAKGIIGQFVNECGANPKAADPIGVFTAHLFSHKDFQWRGQSLIDILLAKFRVVCPVLFGFRGNDKTERGRLAIGWRKDGPAWITEKSHNDRMAGLGAGFAAVSLRDFSKSSKVNPYPPVHYWRAFAGIVNCPANETSNTQYVVLRAMIDGHEQRFLNFFGNAAVAALRLALVEFPKKASQNASEAGSLRALAETLRTESGLALA